MSCYRTWIHFVSRINTWTASIHYSSTDLEGKMLPVMDKKFSIVQGAVYFNQRNNGEDKMALFAEKGCSENVQKTITEPFLKEKINAHNWIKNCIEN